MAYAIVFGAALVSLVLVVELLNNADYLTLMGTDQLHANMLLLNDSFNYGWLIGLTLFAIHLLTMGYVIITSKYMPRVLGILLIFAGLGYLIDSAENILVADYVEYETIFLLIVAVPGFIAEVSLTGWLLFRGGKVQGRDNRTIAPTERGVS